MPDPNDVKLALTLRPEYRAVQLNVTAAEQESNARALLWAPTLSAFGNFHRFNYDNFHLDNYSWAAGAQLDWQLFDGGSRDAARHQANARVVASREQAAVLADRVRDDLANSSADLRTKQQAVDAAQRALGLSKETLDLIRTQYSAGTATQLDLLQAQDAVTSANVALVQGTVRRRRRRPYLPIRRRDVSAEVAHEPSPASLGEGDFVKSCWSVTRASR